ncbi:MAG: restriction endonuclease subunit S [Chloroflexota bacterium]|nr:MAG: restriction endonuclease subunit S [Chloroflexota bacterium]
MSEWKEKKLGRIAEISKDSWKIGDGPAPYIGLEHIGEGSLSLVGLGHSEKVTSNKYRFKNDEFLFGKLRPYFRKVVRPKFDGICSTDIWVVKNRKGYDIDFLFYLFATKEFVDLAYSGSSGTKMPRADWDFMKETEWLIPEEIVEQKAIAAVLSSLDDKIDLLHRQNETLEAMAQSIFRQWFVEEAGDDWDESSLYDAINLIGGGTPKTSEERYWDGSIPWLSGADVSGNHKGFVLSSAKRITEVGLNNSSTKLLPQFSTVISARGTVGKYCLLARPMAFSQTSYGVTPRFEGSHFFTYLLIDHSVNALLSAAYGSVFDTITTRTFQNFVIHLPPEDEILYFEQKVRPYFLRMKLNKDQIHTLEKLRDTLLPKLMSGKVRVRH